MDLGHELEALRATAVRVAMSLCHERDTADDLVQTAMLHMLQRRPAQVRTSLHARNYLCRCIRSAWADEMRRRRRRPAVVPLECAERIGLWDEYDDEEPPALPAEMPAHYRQVLACAARQMDYAQTARAVGACVGTVKSRLHRARAMARKEAPACIALRDE